MKIVNLRLNDELVERIDRIASKMLISRSEVIRQALTLYLSLIDNLGYYFKPSVISPQLEVYEERNSISFDLGNNLSLAIFSVVYGGIGEKDEDWLKAPLRRVAEIMSYQIRVESVCRFMNPLAVKILTGNDLEYSVRFYRHFSGTFDGRVILAENEDIGKTDQSFFVSTVAGLRDMRVKNIPKRGDRIYLYGRIMSGEELLHGKLPDISLFEGLANMVSDGKASSIFPVKGDGLKNACLYASSVAGGRLRIISDVNGSCPATAVIVTSPEMPLEGGVEIGEIL